MMDDTNLEQQRALGVVGVNLVYAALHYRHDLNLFIESLTDDLPAWEMEVDMLKFSGPDFASIDNREVALQLVESNLTDAAYISSTGEVMQASETLYKKPVLVLRGSFNPPTLVHVDMLSSAATEFRKRLANPEMKWIELMEFSINNLFSTISSFTHADFLQRATALQKMGKNVLVSKFGAFHRLGSYLSRYTQEPVGLVLSLDVLEKLFEEKWYDDLPGGILENFGRLFKHQLRLYVYPMLDRETGQMRTIAKAEIPDTLRSLFAYLTENQRILSIAGNANRTLLEFWTTDIRRMLAERNPQWKTLVPPEVAEVYEAGMAKPEEDLADPNLQP
jgi:hypothetical protein